mmetsp:Transcript_37515/g.27662  ORF Transcript_37515/g.27662 Transcript_37515/m.27662 type:complete len:123 (+) Transcript_37515:3007-3375(+)
MMVSTAATRNRSCSNAEEDKDESRSDSKDLSEINADQIVTDLLESPKKDCAERQYSTKAEPLSAKGSASFSFEEGEGPLMSSREPKKALIKISKSKIEQYTPHPISDIMNRSLEEQSPTFGS